MRSHHSGRRRGGLFNNRLSDVEPTTPAAPSSKVTLHLFVRRGAPPWLRSLAKMWDNSPTLRTTNLLRIIVVLLLCAAPSRHAAQAAQDRAAHPIGIIGIPSEIAPVEARLKAPTTTRIQDVVFTSGVIDGTPVVAARSGVGKV